MIDFIQTRRNRIISKFLTESGIHGYPVDPINGQLKTIKLGDYFRYEILRIRRDGLSFQWTHWIFLWFQDLN